jgi:hypothetical protein
LCVDQNQEKAFTRPVVQAVENECEILLAPKQNIAGASHDFVTEFRLRSGPKEKKSESWLGESSAGRIGNREV